MLYYCAYNISKNRQVAAIWLSIWLSAAPLLRMAKRKAQKEKEPSEAASKAARKDTQSKKSPQQAQQAPKKHHIDLAFRGGPLRGKAARLGFLCDVAAEANISVGDVRKMLDGMRVVVGRNLNENKYTRIPDLVRLRVRALPARSGVTVSISGKRRDFKAKEDTKKLLGNVLKPLKDAME